MIYIKKLVTYLKNLFKNNELKNQNLADSIRARLHGHGGITLSEPERPSKSTNQV